MFVRLVQNGEGKWWGVSKAGETIVSKLSIQWKIPKISSPPFYCCCFFVRHVFVLVPLSTRAASIAAASSSLLVSHQAPLWHLLLLPHLRAVGPGGGRSLCPAPIHLHQAVGWLRALPPARCSSAASLCLQPLGRLPSCRGCDSRGCTREPGGPAALGGPQGLLLDTSSSSFWWTLASFLAFR